MKWYKHDPDAWLAGVIELTLEERGAYQTLLCLLYSRDGDVPDDDRFMARACDCRPQTWRRIRNSLIAKSKIRVQTDGKLDANRVVNELQTAHELMFEKSVLNEKRNENKGRSKKTHLKSADTTTSTTTSIKKEEESRDSRRTEKVRRRAGTTIPPDWIPKENHFVEAYALGLPVDAMHAMAHEMRLWAEANSNRAVARKADWDKTFSGWMRRNRKPTRPESFRDQQKQRAQDAYEQLKSHNRANCEERSREAPGLLSADAGERTTDFHRGTGGTVLQLLNPDNPAGDESNPRPARIVQIRSGNRRDP